MIGYSLSDADTLRPKYREKKKLSRCHFAHHKSHRTSLESIPGPQLWNSGKLFAWSTTRPLVSANLIRTRTSVYDTASLDHVIQWDNDISALLVIFDWEVLRQPHYFAAPNDILSIPSVEIMNCESEG